MRKVIQYTSGMSNGFFVVDRGVIAVDGGSEVGEDLFREHCRESGIDPGDVKLIVVTHGHGDHFVNTGCMRAVTGAPILCHEVAAERMVNCVYPHVKPRNATGRRMAAEGMTGFPWEQVPITPDLVKTGNVDLRPWGVEGFLTETPGHMEGSWSLVTAWGDVLVGDLLVTSPFTGRCELGYYAEDPRDGSRLCGSVRRLLEQGQRFYSGHGGPFTREEVKLALSRGREEFLRDLAQGLLEEESPT